MMAGAARWAFGVSLFFVLVCLAVLWETRDIPPGTFEPLGSAPVPQATALIVMLLSLFIAFMAWRSGADMAIGETSAERPHTLDAFATGLLTILYVALLDARVVNFAPLTAIYLFVTIGFLVRFRPRPLIVAALISAVMGWGSALVFTRLFVVDLPGL
ncbi:tripartite tricarboxylate transporter TctB family protein [Acuticoccus kandeliae]|uniref:tripartite tricarboxylate transporter TctB family protein n=1 Tax=Acuticoccus kandeliae TaxID=2073160 RepID=UPI000D3EBF1A|nr:tripartite tricarboxylate transporter TctB family protein [Acuticoccus kandeliae]